MNRMPKGAVRKIIFSLSVIVLSVTTGCATVQRPGKDSAHLMVVGYDYIDVPSVIEESEKHKTKTPISITDAGVYSFAVNVKSYMDIRKNQKGVARKFSGTAQVASAAVAASLAALEASVKLVTGFAGFSAVIPELQNIFQSTDGGEAFRTGSEFIADALSDFLDESDEGRISSDKLTVPGKNLHGRVQASIVVVDKALQQLIPTQKQLKAAVEQIYKTRATDVSALAQKKIQARDEVADLAKRLQTAQDILSGKELKKLSVDAIVKAMQEGTLASQEATLAGLKALEQQVPSEALTKAINDATQRIAETKQAISQRVTEQEAAAAEVDAARQELQKISDEIAVKKATADKAKAEKQKAASERDSEKAAAEAEAKIEEEKSKELEKLDDSST